jgi:hypothetical protein
MNIAEAFKTCGHCNGCSTEIVECDQCHGLVCLDCLVDAPTQWCLACAAGHKYRPRVTVYARIAIDADAIKCGDDVLSMAEARADGRFRSLAMLLEAWPRLVAKARLFDNSTPGRNGDGAAYELGGTLLGVIDNVGADFSDVRAWLADRDVEDARPILPGDADYVEPVR